MNGGHFFNNKHLCQVVFFFLYSKDMMEND